MSDHANGHDAAHHGSEKSPKQSMLTLVFALLIPLLAIVGLVRYYVSAGSPSSAVASYSEQDVAARIQKIGTISMGEANHQPKSGEEVFKAQCTTCHTAGVMGAPKFGDAAAWGPRIATGFAALLNSALKGKNSMPAQGGAAFDESEIGRAVVYMANAGGAKFEEPKAPAAAASAAAPASAAK